jgi:predicted glycosyltransferase
MLAIASYLVDNNPDASVLLISGSPMLHSFRMQPRIDYLKLPCLARTVDGDYVAKHLAIEYQKLIDLRSNLILSAVMHFEPDLILVDKKPFGVSNELALALDFAKNLPSAPKLVLLLRDILDTPDATCEVWRKNRYYEAIDEIYDSVLIVGSPEIFDARREYRFSPDGCGKTEFCGYIRREAGLRTRDSVRNALGVGSSPLVLVTAGGGEDGYQIFNHYLHGLDLVKNDYGFHSILLCGPEMPIEQRKLISARAAQLPHVHVEEFTNDIMSLMDAADVVVSMGGYNTICEILTLRKRAIIIPRVKPVQEQWIRAERMAGLGLLRAIHPDQLSPGALIDAVEQEIDRTNVFRQGMYQIDLDALGRIQSTLNGLVAHPSLTAESIPALRKHLS